MQPATASLPSTTEVPVPAPRPGWEVVIGLETHAQLATRSKIFSGASTAFGAQPNLQACAVDLALPGTLPVLNTAAVDCAIRLGLALGSRIAPRSVFARKNYFYPDLPKGYQISQMDLPVVVGGSLEIHVDDVAQVVRLTRAHLEEDAGKSLHEDFHGMSGIDLNRAGTPLLEIVSEPDMRSAKQAVAYARTLHGLVTWLGICDGNMQEGSFRVDANVSVRRTGQAAYGTRCEIKNLNSFRFLEQAIDFEIARQIDLIEDGGRVVQETRLYDPDAGETRSMRSKEDAHDYRYFPDPDLPALVIDAARIDTVSARMPELPQVRRARYRASFGLGAQDVLALTASRAVSDFFEAAFADPVIAAAPGAVKPLANWVITDLAAQLNRDGVEVGAAPIAPAVLGRLVARVVDGTLSGSGARELFQRLWREGARSADAVDRAIDDSGLRQISDDAAIVPLVDAALAANPKSVEEFRAGKEKALNALVGQVMKASKGKGNPQRIGALLRERIG
ncbi:MAG: Asp-tRNA(Asn)/Glu-tRNA(Gln) amidotransferase subunit GatB [Lautropia sp.]